MTHGSADILDPNRNSGDDASNPERLSGLLNRLLRQAGPRISIRDMAEAMGERSFGALLFVFSLPSLIPLPPGATLILGLPLIFITWQIASGRSEVWLPRRLNAVSLRRATFEKIVRKTTPWLDRMEAFVRPRRWMLHTRSGERVFGLYALVLACAVVIPIPFGNWLPAFALAVMSIAYVERDGTLLIAGVVIGLISIAVAAAICVAGGLALSILL